jgi:hypothetical protein
MTFHWKNNAFQRRRAINIGPACEKSRCTGLLLVVEFTGAPRTVLLVMLAKVPFEPIL